MIAKKLLVLSIAAALFAFSCKSKLPECAVCKREIHRGMMATLKLEDEAKHTCCIACGLHFKSSAPAAEFVSVTDFNTGKEFPANHAVYLYGPDVQTCDAHNAPIRTPESVAYVNYDRCRPAVLAFTNRDSALAVKKEYGGKIYTLPEIVTLFKTSTTQTAPD